VVTRWWVWAAAAVVVLVIGGGVAWHATKNNPSSATSTTRGSAVSSTTATTQRQAASAGTTTSSTSSTSTTSIPPTTFFTCSGSAPGGVRITYGTDSSNVDGGSSLPWHAYLPVTSGVQSYFVLAQLHGTAGRVTCSTAVDVNGSIVTQTATATGGHSAAIANVCSNGDVWQRC